MHINVHTTEGQAWTCMQILNAISAEQAQDLPQLAGGAADRLDARTGGSFDALPVFFFKPSLATCHPACWSVSWSYSMAPPSKSFDFAQQPANDMMVTKTCKSRQAPVPAQSMELSRAQFAVVVPVL